MIDPAKQLLSHINTLNEKYRLISKATGDDFNIFEILRLEEAEVKHSAFIAELLDVNGSHQQCDLFLNLFLQRLRSNKKIPDDFNLIFSKTTVEIEKYIGSDGRIDIFICDGITGLIIENKIYAIDQQDQLRRYDRYGSKYKKHHILYLNLDGHKPQGTEDIVFEIITYKELIIPWIEECIKECYSKPKIRETLAQYLQIIKYLSGMINNNDKVEEISNLIISSQAYFQASIDILNSMNEVKIKIQLKFWNDLIDKFQSSGYTIKESLISFNQIRDFYAKKNNEYGFKSSIVNFNDKYYIDLYVAIDSDFIPFYGLILYERLTNTEIGAEQMARFTDEFKIIRNTFENLLPNKHDWYWNYLEPTFNFFQKPINEYATLLSDKIINSYFHQVHGTVEALIKLLTTENIIFNTLSREAVTSSLE